MLTGYTSHRGVIASDDRPRDRLETVTRWLANQRAVPLGQVEPTAWALIESYRDGKLVLEGSAAPLIIQQRFALWIVGQLGGRPLIRVFVDQAAAIEKARELGREMRVPVLVIGGAGEIAERFDPEPAIAPALAASASSVRVAPPAPAVPSAKLAPPAPAVPSVKVAPPAPAVPLVEVATPAPAVPSVEVATPESAPSVTLKVARFEERWAVFVADRVIATAPTRERARQRARMLKADPDFMADPKPVADE